MRVALEANRNRAGVVITKCSASGQIALAYDDGPYQYTQKLSDILKNGGAKGTFFVTGTLYGKHFGA
jgi:peptidoglycan/xylan/chitin deacetylase (PgdA/CDA1 family)